MKKIILRIIPILLLLPTWCVADDSNPRLDFLRGVRESINGYTPNPYVAQISGMLVEYWLLMVLGVVLVAAISLLVHAFIKTPEQHPQEARHVCPNHRM